MLCPEGIDWFHEEGISRFQKKEWRSPHSSTIYEGIEGAHYRGQEWRTFSPIVRRKKWKNPAKS